MSPRSSSLQAQVGDVPAQQRAGAPDDGRQHVIDAGQRREVGRGLEQCGEFGLPAAVRVELVADTERHPLGPLQRLDVRGRQPRRAGLDHRPLELDRGGVPGQQVEQVTHPRRHPHGHHAATGVHRRSRAVRPACSDVPAGVASRAGAGGAGGPLGRAGDQRAPHPPSSTRSDPVIESLPGEHRYTAAAATSAGSISRFTGDDARITLLSTSSSDNPCATA